MISVMEAEFKVKNMLYSFVLAVLCVPSGRLMSICFLVSLLLIEFLRMRRFLPSFLLKDETSAFSYTQASCEDVFHFLQDQTNETLRFISAIMDIFFRIT